MTKTKRCRTLGCTAFRVSDIGTGSPWNEGILSTTLDAGVNYIDTAEAYHQGRSEIAIGKVLKNRSREKIFVTTKVGLRGNESKENILQRVRKCLERLTSADKTHAGLKDFYTNYMPRFKAQAEAAQKFLDKYKLKNPAEIRDAAITFALSHESVHTVLGSLDSFETMEAFLKLSGRSLSQMDKKKLGIYEKGCGKFYCRHACGICEPQCPHQVPVNTIMRYNYYFEVKNQEKYAMEAYARLDSPKADNCLNCEGPCESACPYKVPIRGLLALAHQTLTLNPQI